VDAGREIFWVFFCAFDELVFYMVFLILQNLQFVHLQIAYHPTDKRDFYRSNFEPKQIVVRVFRPLYKLRLIHLYLNHLNLPSNLLNKGRPNKFQVERR